MFRSGRVVFWCSWVGAVPVARQKYLGFGVLCWERKVIRAEKIADGRVPLPAKSGYISENRGTVLEKSRGGRVYPAVFKVGVNQSAVSISRCK